MFFITVEKYTYRINNALPMSFVVLILYQLNGVKPCRFIFRGYTVVIQIRY